MIISFLNGTGNYSADFRTPDGHEELFCVLGASGTGGQGLPAFRHDAASIVVHEFCHSYCNPLVDRHLRELQPSGEALFQRVSEKMRSQAYRGGATLVKESLVRACVVRYRRQYEGEQVARAVIQFEKQNGFLWMSELADLLQDYEAHREQYPALEDFSPRLSAFFADAAKNVSKMQTGLTTRNAN